MLSSRQPLLARGEDGASGYRSVQNYEIQRLSPSLIRTNSLNSHRGVGDGYSEIQFEARE